MYFTTRKVQEEPLLTDTAVSGHFFMVSMTDEYHNLAYLNTST